MKLLNKYLDTMASKFYKCFNITDLAFDGVSDLLWGKVGVAGQLNLHPDTALAPSLPPLRIWFCSSGVGVVQGPAALCFKGSVR